MLDAKLTAGILVGDEDLVGDGQLEAQHHIVSASAAARMSEIVRTMAFETLASIICHGKDGHC